MEVTTRPTRQGGVMGSFADDLKKMAEDLELERRAAELAATAEQVFSRGLGMAGDFAHDHADDVAGFLDKAGDAIDERTGRPAPRPVADARRRGHQRLGCWPLSGPPTAPDELEG